MDSQPEVVIHRLRDVRNLWIHYSVVASSGLLASGLQFTRRRRFDRLVHPLVWGQPGHSDWFLVVVQFHHRHLDHPAGQQVEDLLFRTLSDLLACMGVEPGGSTLVIECKPEYQAL